MVISLFQFSSRFSTFAASQKRFIPAQLSGKSARRRAAATLAEVSEYQTNDGLNVGECECSEPSATYT